MKLKGLDSAQSAFFVKQLEHIKAKVLEKVFPEFKMLRYIPISYEVPPGAETITRRMWTKLGMAKIIANNAHDLPKVTIESDENSVPVRTIGDAIDYTIKEIQSAAMAGISLTDKKMVAARRAFEAELNRIALFGDSKHGLYGLLTHPNVIAGNLPNGGWTSSTSVDDLLEDLDSLADTSYITSNGVEQPDTILMPIAALKIIRNKRSTPGQSETVLEYFQKTHPGMTIDDVVDLASVPFTPSTGALTPTKVAVAFKRDPEKLTLEIPQDFTSLPPQERGLGFEVPCYGYTGGVMSDFPLSINIGQGILP